MEHLEQSLKQWSSENEQPQLQNQLQTTQTLNEISIYQGELTKEVFVKETAKILQAFPKMPVQMFNLLKERFKDNKFTDARLKDSVNNVIDSYEGFDKIPNIANFISFDKKVKIYTHSQVTAGNLWQDVECIRVDGLDKPRWILKEDFVKGSFEKWDNK